MAGIWALGLMLYTLALKMAMNTFRRSPLQTAAPNQTDPTTH
jgi:hypothetical protein